MNTPANKGLRLKNCLMALLGSAILAFGLCHVHSQAAVTEGGTLGLILLLEHWFRLSPAVTGAVLNLSCYLFGWRVLGRDFIGYSLVATLGFSAAYALAEQLDPVFPMLGELPLAASLLGAVFVGVGTGLSVRAGGAASGDDALAMSLTALTGMKIENIYLISDMVVLLLSLSYIPLERIGYSLLTVVLSGRIIGWLQPRHQSPS